MKITSSFVITLLLSGCAKIASGPDATRVIPPDQFVYADDAGGEFDSKQLLPNDDVAFQKLNTLGLASAPSLLAAIARIDAARAQVANTKAARLPEISANGSITGQRRSLAAQGGSFGGDRTSSEFQLGLNALWDADIFGRLRASQRAAQARLDASTQDSAAVRLALTTDIAKAVIAHRDASARREIVQQDLADAQALAAVTSARAQSGVISGLDVARATSLVRDAQSRLTPFDAETAAAISQLITLTALPASDVQTILREASVDTFNPILAFAVPSQVLRSRPDIQAALFRLSAANADLAAAAAARFPRLSLNGTLGTLALAAGDIFSGNALYGTLGASIVGPLLDFGRTASEIDRRKANATESYENYRSAVFTAVGEVESSLAALSAETAGANARIAQRAADADTLSIAQERYRLGLTDFLAVIDAQRRLNISRLAVQTSTRNIANARVQLYRALGGAG
jgi:NodT family efflux transporter outer membrane factor (OMF) lipoprotein